MCNAGTQERFQPVEKLRLAERSMVIDASRTGVRLCNKRAVFLASDESSPIAGVPLLVDGGMCAGSAA